MNAQELVARKRRIGDVVERLSKEFDDWTISLDYDGPWQLLVATILSAQSTDAMVNQVTPALFARFPTAEAMAAADVGEVEKLVHSTGFYRQKAKHITETSRRIVGEHDGDVPRSMAELTSLPGVARKTANVVLHNAWGIAEGIAVDTHVKRVAGRLGLTDHANPDKVEVDLMALLPMEDWHRITHLLIEHGRATCDARKPACGRCCLRDVCPSAKRFLAQDDPEGDPEGGPADGRPA